MGRVWQGGVRCDAVWLREVAGAVCYRGVQGDAFRRDLRVEITS